MAASDRMDRIDGSAHPICCGFLAGNAVVADVAVFGIGYRLGLACRSECSCVVLRRRLRSAPLICARDAACDDSTWIHRFVAGLHRFEPARLLAVLHIH